MSGLCLRAIARDPAAYAQALLQAGCRRAAFVPDDAFAIATREVLAQHPEPPEHVEPAAADVVCFTHEERVALEAALLSELDRSAGTLLIPQLPGMARDRPLFVISIPKAGTHLLLRLVEAFGFLPGIVCPDVPSNGHWYCIEYSNTHTVPRDFFVDTVRRAPFGNRAHPFLRSAALFIVRHPADILLSEANYYHRPGRTAFAGWLDGLDLDGRVVRLLEDDVMLGRFGDRVRAFAPWLQFSNVIPVSFEELVGEDGGGDKATQLRTIWSIQLKLGMPGRPEELAAEVFSRASPTFAEGRVGAHRTALDPALRARVNRELAPAYAVYGYEAGGPYSRAAEAWRRRPLRIGGIDFGATPILVDANFLDHGLVFYRDRFYGVDHALGPLDLTLLDPAALAALPQSGTLTELRFALAMAPLRAVLETVERRAAEQKADDVELRARLDALTLRTAALEATMEERSKRIAALEASWNSGAANFASLVDTLAERTGRLASLEAEISELKGGKRKRRR